MNLNKIEIVYFVWINACSAAHLHYRIELDALRRVLNVLGKISLIYCVADVD